MTIGRRPVAGALARRVRRHRNPRLRRTIRPQADEIFGRDANDRIAHRVDLDHGTEHVLPRAKLRLPHRAAEYRDGRWIGGAVLGGREIASQYRRRIEEAEESG